MAIPEPAYLTPSSEAELAGLLACFGQRSRILAGGQTLIPLLLRDRMSCDAIIDLRLAGLDRLVIAESEVTMGAMVTLTQARAELAPVFPSLGECLGRTANSAVRNRATFGGSIALADPASEPFAFMVAFDASMTLISPGGVSSRQVSTAAEGLAPDEAILGFTIPRPPTDEVAAFSEILRRRSGGRALAMAFARRRPSGTVVTVSGSGLLPMRIDIRSPGSLAEGVARLATAPSIRAWLFAAARRAVTSAGGDPM